MKIPDQVYKTTIDTTPAQLWEAITNPEFTKQYWFGNANVSSWEEGADWKHVGIDSGTVHHVGKVEEIDPPRRLVLSWHNEGDTRDVSRVTFAITPVDQGVELVITHGDFIEDSAMAKRVSGGWPKVVAGLKEFLEGRKPG
jgi:uncharacterized protein YndB with AHSA1/START domain